MDLVTLKCVKEHSKLRVRIVSPGYAQHANCQFPRDIRLEGRVYTVPRNDISVAESRGKFFYRVKKDNVKIVENEIKEQLKIYGDAVGECSICLEEAMDLLIFVPCGHRVACAGCASRVNTCPICRQDIRLKITEDQLE